MRKLLQLFLLVSIASANLDGALYDPFKLSIYSDAGLRYNFVGLSDLEPVFYFSVYKHANAVNQILREARTRAKKLFVNRQALATRRIQVRFMHTFAWQDEKFLPEDCEMPQVVKVSNQSINFDWQTVEKSNIKSSKYLATWVTFTAQGKSESYWLSSAQHRRLNELLASSDTLMVNFSALGLFSDYRDALPLHHQFKNFTVINGD